MTCEKLPMTETPDYVAELKPSAIFIWEFKGNQKRMVGSMDRMPETERAIAGFMEVMNGKGDNDDNRPII